MRRPPAAGASRHLQRVEDHVGAHVRRHAPTDDASARDASTMKTHVGHPRPGRHVGRSVTHRPSGRSGPKVAAHQIGAGAASGSGRVVNTRLCAATAHATISLARMSRAT